MRVLPPLQLTDQIQLLTSGSKNWPTDQPAPDDDDGDEPFSEPSVSKDRKASLSRQDSSDTEKMKIPSNQPPWIEMVLVSLCGIHLYRVKGGFIVPSMKPNTKCSNYWIFNMCAALCTFVCMYVFNRFVVQITIECILLQRRKRSNSSTSSTHTNPSADGPVVVYEPPPRKPRVDSEPSRPQTEPKGDSLWDRDPTLDVTTGLYDTLQPKPADPVYLHEKIAAQHGSSSVEPSPRLPPRNNLALKRTASDETTTKPSSDKAVRRRGSERRSSRESRKDKESHSSGSRSRESSKDKPTREARSRDKGAHESRSREKDRHSSRHRSHSAERSEHRHTSSHRSRSGDRSSSHSTERHSSHHHSSSERHRSSSRDKHSSATPKPSKDTSSKFKVLSSPHSSRSKLATSLFSRSSSKDKGGTQKESEKRKKLKSEGSKKTRSSSEKSSRSRGSTGSSKESSPDSGEMVRSSVALTTCLHMFCMLTFVRVIVDTSL